MAKRWAPSSHGSRVLVPTSDRVIETLPGLGQLTAFEVHPRGGQLGIGDANLVSVGRPSPSTSAACRLAAVRLPRSASSQARRPKHSAAAAFSASELRRRESSGSTTDTARVKSPFAMANAASCAARRAEISGAVSR